jgi:hypothetical protein
VYILTVDKLLEHRAVKPEMFNNYILMKLLELANDKIPNIRLCIAKCLSFTLMENRKSKKTLSSTDIFQQIPFAISAYYNNEFRDSKKHIQQKIISLEKDPDRDVRDNVFSAFSEKEKTESPSSDEISDDILATSMTSPVETVETSPTSEQESASEDTSGVSDQPTDSET